MATSTHPGRQLTPVDGVESKPGVQGGSPCIAGTRIPVATLEGYRRLGSADEQLLEMYPTLQAKDLAAAWKFVRLYPEVIDREIRENER